MNSIGKELYKSIHQGKWVSIEYRNKGSQVTKYWISIISIDIHFKSLKVNAFNIMKNMIPQEYDIYFQSIVSAEVIEGTYFPKNITLIEEISTYPEKYDFIFSSNINLSVLDYLQECNQYDTTPYKTNYLLIRLIDEDTVMKNEVYSLSDQQFHDIVFAFQSNQEKQKQYFLQTKLGMNILSIKTKKGLYVLAYKKLLLDISKRILIPDKEIMINREFSIEDVKFSIQKFLPEEDCVLLEDFSKNRKAIIDSMAGYIPHPSDITTSPFILEVQYNNSIDLGDEYKGIYDMFSENRVTTPIKAFFGDLKVKSRRTKNYPITLINNKVNLDQLLTIHKAMKYPITYVQGPPGTGKTNTIINTVISAFFNEKTVLVSSYNNHPMNGVYEKLREMKFGEYQIPFPAIRLGNNDYVLQALNEIKSLFEPNQKITVYEDFLSKNRTNKEKDVKALSDLLELYEEKLDLIERKETIKQLLSDGMPMKYSVDIEADQLNKIDKRIQEIGFITNEQAISLLEVDYDNFIKYLNYVSIKYIQKLKEPKYLELLEIVADNDEILKVSKFNKYISQEDNLKNFLRVFPIVITTNISAHHLGEPKPIFDLTIMDEASQCNNAVSLIPIIRGENLLLVGDPQQLNPVILLDPQLNKQLMRKYKVPKEYNYIENSIYKTYLATDSISDEILLSYHYRCHPQIIGFNNKKYYNNKLVLKSEITGEKPLVYVDAPDTGEEGRNTSLAEAENIIDYIKNHPGENIGIITPFVRQKELINTLLDEAKLPDIRCGTVHAFQGSEKDVILFSSAITKDTKQKTYDWLKNNKELINVATSRAKNQLIMFGDEENIKRLNINSEPNDYIELYEYIKKNGTSEVTSKAPSSRALGIKPFSSELEADFMMNLRHALDITNEKCILRKEVPISSIFKKIEHVNQLFYTGRFDFVVFKKTFSGKEFPVFAIELDGPEHRTDEDVMLRDRKKNEICKQYKLKLIRVENVYARRYNDIKEILLSHFRNQ